MNLMALINLWLNINCQITTKYATVVQSKLFHQLSTPFELCISNHPSIHVDSSTWNLLNSLAIEECCCGIFLAGWLCGRGFDTDGLRLSLHRQLPANFLLSILHHVPRAVEPIVGTQFHCYFTRCVRLACQSTSQRYCSLILNQHLSWLKFSRYAVWWVVL